MYVLALKPRRSAGCRGAETGAGAHDADRVRRELDCRARREVRVASRRRSGTGIRPAPAMRDVARPTDRAELVFDAPQTCRHARPGGGVLRRQMSSSEAAGSIRASRRRPLRTTTAASSATQPTLQVFRHAVEIVLGVDRRHASRARRRDRPGDRCDPARRRRRTRRGRWSSPHRGSRCSRCRPGRAGPGTATCWVCGRWRRRRRTPAFRSALRCRCGGRTIDVTSPFPVSRISSTS